MATKNTPIDDENDDIVQIAQDAYQEDQSAWSSVYNDARQDLEFLSDEDYAQWDNTVFKDRLAAGQSVLTIDQLGQFIHQVVNDIRQNTPSINVLPANDESDRETADIYKGLIRQIEYQSNADAVYDTAADFSVKSSLGFIRVDHDYANSAGPEQILCIKRVINPLAVYIDNNSIECDGRDAKRAEVLEDMPVSEFKRRWPGFEPCSFVGKKQKNYKMTDTVTVCEFFRIEEETKNVGYDDEGKMQPDDGKSEFKIKRKLTKKKVMRYWLSGQDVLEKGEFPGKYIPIIPVYGEEAWIDGRRKIYSLIRKSKDVQRMYNLWASTETDLLLKQPNAPVMVPAGAIENYAADWQNPTKSMALRYDQQSTDGSITYNKPERLQPPTIPTGIVNAKAETLNDIKATLGMYNANIGQRSNAVSGVAYNAQKIEGDVATAHFGDNLVRSIAQCGRVLVSAIPEVYDSARIIQIIGVDDEPQQVGINGKMSAEQKQHFDLTKGQYDVRVTTGPSFTTRRQETVAALQETFKGSPELFAVLGDLYFRNSDFAGAESMAERMKMIVEKQNPGLTSDGKEQDPQVAQMAQVITQAQQQIQMLTQQLQALEGQARTAETEAKMENLKGQIDSAAKELKLQEQIAKLTIELEKTQAMDEVKAAGQPPAPQNPALPPGFQLPEGLQLVKTPEAEQAEALHAQIQEQTTAAALQQAEQMRQIQETQNQMVVRTLAGVQEAVMQLAAVINQPKQVIYGPDGRLIGVQ